MSSEKCYMCDVFHKGLDATLNSCCLCRKETVSQLSRFVNSPFFCLVHVVVLFLARGLFFFWRGREEICDLGLVCECSVIGTHYNVLGEVF